MAIRFDIKKYEKIKAAYIAILHTGGKPSSLQGDFCSYKNQLSNDSDIKAEIARMKTLPAPTFVIAEEVKQPEVPQSGKTQPSPKKPKIKNNEERQVTSSPFIQTPLVIPPQKLPLLSKEEMVRLIDDTTEIHELEDIKKKSRIIMETDKELSLFIFRYAQERIDVLKSSFSQHKRLHENKKKLIQQKKLADFSDKHPTKIIYTPIGGQNGKTHH